MSLRIYRDALQMVGKAYRAAEDIARRDPDLARQLKRSSSSVPLNISEGDRSTKGTRTARYVTAMGSANEVRATLEVAASVGFIDRDAVLDDQLDKIWKKTRARARHIETLEIE